MATKIDMIVGYEMANPTVQSDFIWVQGRGVEIQRGQIQKVRPVYQEVMQEANANYRKFATSNMQISGSKPQEYNSI